MITFIFQLKSKFEKLSNEKKTILLNQSTTSPISKSPLQRKKYFTDDDN